MCKGTRTECEKCVHVKHRVCKCIGTKYVHCVDVMVKGSAHESTHVQASKELLMALMPMDGGTGVASVVRVPFTSVMGRVGIGNRYVRM